MSGVIEALHIFEDHHRPLLSHTYTGRPLSPSQLLPLYLAQPEPRPSLIYLPNTNPPTLLFNLSHANLLFLLTTSSEIEPLLALEFLHRVIDVFEEFLGAPLLASKIESSYDVVAQLLNEMCDTGVVSTTEGNALRDLVEVEGWIGKFLGGINLPGNAPFSSNTPTQMPGISSLGPTSTPALPWRRANVKHTSNELYVDIVETLSVIIAPSGRPLSAFATGSIAFTAKVSGVPDVLLSLSSPSGRHNIDSTMELPVFHPCVRLAHWRSHPGELSFVPPDGRFILAGYEVNLLPLPTSSLTSSSNNTNLKLPVSLEVKTSLGPTGSEFEVRLLLSPPPGPGQSSSSMSSLGARSSRLGGSTSGSAFGSGGSTPKSNLEGLTVTVPIPADVRNLSEIRASRGDTTYAPGAKSLEWHIPIKEAGAGTATLRCSVVGNFDDDDEGSSNAFTFEQYDETEGYQAAGSSPPKAGEVDAEKVKEKDDKTVARNKLLMPTSARVSFGIKGWLASGLKVDSLIIDSRKSRGLGDGVKPYKGVKYLSVSRGGVEVRC
ncbi:hypothetical protein V500_06756 [Pseudogymnoascus sp. VKM F-4518 (FW-2643)]|nr:hypothetical protein V500_06756 [Pseudogymnoascus sp. VKM F-4518 (FW-2643)]